MTNISETLLREVNTLDSTDCQEVLDCIKLMKTRRELRDRTIALVEDKGLRERAIGLAERYFDDMCLKVGSIAENYFWVGVDVKIEDQTEIENREFGWEDWKIENGEVFHYELPDEMSYVLDGAAFDFHYVVDELESGAFAEVNYGTRSVTIAPKYVNDDTVLLNTRF
jgi:hypothetical protein